MVTFIKSKKFLLILLLLIFISSSTALALEIDWPQTPRPGGITLTDDSDVGDMVQYFYEWAIALGGLATFFSLVLGGFKYLSSMGRPEMMKDAKDQITSAFAGLILLLSAWLILNIINPDLTTFKRGSYNLDKIREEYYSFEIGRMVSCDYVELYDNNGSPIPTTEGETKIYEGFGMIYLTAIPRSVRAFRNGKECAQDGCGCQLQLSIDEDNDGVCDKMVVEYSAYSDDITEMIDPENRQKLKCAEIQGGGCNACYVEDDDGKCIYQEDTGWGEDEYLCIGSDKRDKRCFDGECRICQGHMAEDGCGGCATPGIPGTLACWHKAPYNNDIFRAGFSCDYTCKDYGGCIQENWNDNSCSVCAHFFPSANICTNSFCILCREYGLTSSPQFDAYLTSRECNARMPSLDQVCSHTADQGTGIATTVGAPWRTRLCVCGW